MEASLLPGWLRYRHGAAWWPLKAAYGVLAWFTVGAVASAVVAACVAVVAAAVWLLTRV